MFPRSLFARAFFPRRPARRAFRPGPAAAARAAAWPAPACEVLEDRLVLTGNVEAFVSGRNVFVIGDDAANEIEVVEIAGSGTLEVRVRDGGTLNGGTEAVRLPDLPDFLVVLTGGGDDVVTVGDPAGVFNVVSGVYVGLGAGDDFLQADMVSAGYFAALGGDGDDRLIVGNDSVEFPTRNDFAGVSVDDVYVYGEAGDDEADVFSSSVPGAFVVVMGEGDNVVTTANNNVVGTAYIYGGSGFDGFTSTADRFNREGGGFLVVALGDGRGTLDLIGTAVGGTALIFTGAGEDVVRMNGGLYAGQTFLYAGAGDDRVAVERVQFNSAVVVSGDAGDDTLFESGNMFRGGLSAFGFEF